MTEASSLDDRNPVASPATTSPNIWFYEDQTPHRRLSLRARRVLEDYATKFQQLTVLELYDWGTTLVLDGCVQMCEGDEFMYHEMLVHPPLFSLPKPAIDEGVRVLIIGGGDGGTAREVLKHEGIAHVDLVDIDPDVTKVSKVHFRHIWDMPDGSRLDEDRRLSIHFDDGIEWARHHAEKGTKYHVVLVDSSDPIGPGVGLFSEAFYRNLWTLVPDNGVVAVQSGSPVAQPQVTSLAAKGLRKAFGKSVTYTGIVANYPAGYWSYTGGSKGGHLGPAFKDPEGFRKRYERFVKANGALRYYNPEVHAAAFALPGFVRELVDSA